MNLAYIEIHRGNASDAFTFFKKALTLPINLDNASKSRTLWATSRLYYAEGKYQEALSYAEQSIRLDSPKDPKKIFSSGVYAALAGNVRVALEKIEQAIHLDPIFFTLAATEPDLQVIRSEVLTFLSELSNHISDKAQKLIKDSETFLSQINKNKGNSEYARFLSEAQKTFSRNKGMLKNPSYSDYVLFLNEMTTVHSKLKIACNIIPEIDQQIARIKELGAKQQTMRENLRYTEQRRQQVGKSIPQTIDADKLKGAIIISGIVIGYFAILVMVGLELDWGAAGLWPLSFILAVLTFLIGDRSGAWEFFSPAFKGLGIAIILTVIVWKILQFMIGLHTAKRKSINQNVSNYTTQMRKINMEKENVENEISRLREKIGQQIAQLQL